ncbi:response regulator [Sphingomonas astaxanthinifaciens]|uniref:Response regulator n=1 Tax=Sphingomonas astaxanthinifaciens DSM 22298 TaxID=1123267 RepID=A0ABQ5ZB77_9SPHN|nr:response regulator [Sphingomonas astaxanthinifaciens]GLR48766.1 response regulator [Sphingomonas astaxanthinifaciens DSM 22298]
MQQGRAILVVEDEPLIAMMLEDFLETLGHRIVASCDNLPDAIVQCREGEFDLAILDVNLKGELVWPAAEALKERGLPFVIASGGHVEPPPAVFADAPLLEKPYTIDRIGPVLEQAGA